VVYDDEHGSPRPNVHLLRPSGIESESPPTMGVWSDVSTNKSNDLWRIHQPLHRVHQTKWTRLRSTR